MATCNTTGAHSQHHRGKSSERFLDKEKILTTLSITPGQAILDAGCGNGYTAKAFAELTGKTGRVYALDSDSISIDALKLETAGTVIEPFVGDITKETRLAASSMDLIYLSTVVHGFSKRLMEEFLREAKRLLKPGRRLAIVEIEKTDPPFGPPLDMRLSPEELRQTISLAPAQTPPPACISETDSYAPNPSGVSVSVCYTSYPR